MSQGISILTKKQIALVVALLSVIAFINPVTSKEKSTPMETAFVETPSYTGNISWVEQPAERAALANIVGIHGTPGSWTAWRALMSDPDILDYQFYAFDRPGWGESQSEDTQVYPTLKVQAESLASVLMNLQNDKPTILVAHSWGGPVALALAIYYPELVDGMVLIASPASAVQSEPRWYHKAAKAKVVQWVIGKSMARSNVEMLTLDDELKQIESMLEKITAPTVIMQGKKDWLVKPQNAFFLQRKLANTNVRLNYDMKANHFIPFKNTPAVVSEIEWVLRNLPTVTAKQ
jgi:pimeloyl-ACP methyl ester carboxylesterase